MINPYVLAYICFFATAGGALAAIFGAITWMTAGLILVGSFVAAIGNGLIMAALISKHERDNE